MSMHELFSEAQRQLNICNACRYCAGYCPVWPALELRNELSNADVHYLANLCHDCRDCFSACMYTEPHEFALNPPKLFTEVREQTYRTYAWPSRRPKWLSNWVGVVVVVVLAAFVVALGVLDGGTSDAPSASPYAVISHSLLIAMAGVPALFALGVVAVGAIRFWRQTGGTARGALDLAAWRATFAQAATLRHQTGGDEGCNIDGSTPSAKRRIAHQLLAYGLLLTFASTTSAAFTENILGILPPYGYVSAPVILGTVGGLMASVGCVALLALKRVADREQTTPTMRRADLWLLWALLVLNVSGLFVLALRTTNVFGLVFGIHMVAVIASFVVLPYTKFVHWIYRMLAMQHNNNERAQELTGA